MRRSGAILVVAALGACAPGQQYTMGNNPGAAGKPGRWTQGSSCAVRVVFQFGEALPNRAIDDAIRRANERDRPPPGEEYNALVDGELRDVGTAFSYCFEASGYPARLALGGAP